MRILNKLKWSKKAACFITQDHRSRDQDSMTYMMKELELELPTLQSRDEVLAIPSEAYLTPVKNKRRVCVSTNFVTRHQLIHDNCCKPKTGNTFI